MYPLMDTHLAADHIADLHRNAEHARLVRSARRSRTNPLRKLLGVRLVAAGLHLLDARR